MTVQAPSTPTRADARRQQAQAVKQAQDLQQTQSLQQSSLEEATAAHPTTAEGRPREATGPSSSHAVDRPRKIDARTIAFAEDARRASQGQGAGDLAGTPEPRRMAAAEAKALSDAGPAVGSKPLPPGLQRYLQSEVDAMRKQARNPPPAGFIYGTHNDPSAGDRNPTGTFVGSAGSPTEAGKAKLDPNAKMPIGSLTKTFTSVMVLQLVEEGKLKLDDPVSKHLPGFPGGDKVTVRDLLAHTSGIPDYLADESFDISKPHTKQELYEQIAKQTKDAQRRGAEVPPADNTHAYSNSNYHLLGMIIEKQTGKSYQQNLKERIFEPAKMNDSRLKSERSKDPMVRGTTHDGERSHDVTEYEHPSNSWAAGGGESTAGDMLRFQKMLFSGKLFKNKSTLDEMLKPQGKVNQGEPQPGLGIFIAPGPNGPLYTHDGSVPGFGARMEHDPQQRMSNIYFWNGD